MHEITELADSLQRNRVSRRQVLWLFGAAAFLLSHCSKGLAAHGLCPPVWRDQAHTVYPLDGANHVHGAGKLPPAATRCFSKAPAL